MQSFRPLAAAAALVAALVLPCAAQAGFAPPLPITQAGATDLDIGVDSSGNAVAAWVVNDPSEIDVWMSTRPAGGAWTAPVQISTDSPSSSNDDAFTPKVTVAPDGGRAIITWHQNTALSPSRTIVRSVVGTAGGNFGSEQVLAPTSGNSEAAEPVFDGEGNAYLVYNAGLNANNAMFVRELPWNTGIWGAPTEIPNTRLVDSPQYRVDADVDPAGNLVVGWISGYMRWNDTDPLNDVRVAHRPVGGEWDTAIIDNLEDGHEPQVAIDGAGRAVVAYADFQLAALSFSAPAPSWSTPGPMTSNEVLLDVQTDADGGLVFLRRPNSGSSLKVSRMASDATLPVDAGAIDGDSNRYDRQPVLVTGPAGDSAVVWSDDAGEARLAIGDADGEWAAPEILTGVASYYPAVATFDSGGSLLLGVLREEAGTPGRIGTLVPFDRTAPVLTAASFQTDGVTGQPLAFSAAGEEDWSAVDIAWDFGDGTTGVGGEVEHAYASPGSYEVTATLSSAGGETWETMTVTIAAPQEHTPPPVDHKPETPAAPPVAPPSAAPVFTPAQVIEILSTFVKAPVATPKKVAFQQAFPSAGKAVWDLYLGKPKIATGSASIAKKAKAVRLGTSKKAIAAAGNVAVKIKVAKKKRRALKKAKKANVYVRTTFTDATGRTFVTVTRSKLKR